MKISINMFSYFALNSLVIVKQFITAATSERVGSILIRVLLVATDGIAAVNSRRWQDQRSLEQIDRSAIGVYRCCYSSVAAVLSSIVLL